MSRRLRDEAWRRIRDGLEVGASAKVLLLAIAEHCDGELRAAEETIAEWVALSPRSVRRLRSELIGAGCLTQTARAAPGQAPRFLVLSEENTGQPMADEHRPGSADVGGGHPLQHRPGFDEHRPSSAHTPANPDRQNQKEPKEPARASTESEFQKWAEDRAAAKGGGLGLLNKILAEDRHIFEAEQVPVRRIIALNACNLCDGSGWRLGPDGIPIEPTERCDHVSEPIGENNEALAR